MGRPKLSTFEKSIRMQIARNIKDLAKGMTQREISDKTKIPASTLSGYFNETSTISPENLSKLSKLFNVDPKVIDPREGGSLHFRNTLGSTMVKNEIYKDSESGRTIRYQILLVRESDPAMLKPAAGRFQIVIRLLSGIEFPLNCDYVPLDENGQSFYVTTSKAFADEVDSQAYEANYDQYTAEIHPDLPGHIQTALDNAIKIYFMDTIRKPLSIEPYHNI